MSRNFVPTVGAAGTPGAAGLRERKKRLMRQQLSDTATQMFLEHGFDGVRVSDIAEACGVSQKTVFNYFPTKESLILDPEPQIAAAALLGLWRIQFQSLSRYLDGSRTPAQVHQAVTADVRRAAQLIETGLSSFAAFSSGTDDDGG
jgi:AcrR family transcriptional regulator